MIPLTLKPAVKSFDRELPDPALAEVNSQVELPEIGSRPPHAFASFKLFVPASPDQTLLIWAEAVPAIIAPSRQLKAKRYLANRDVVKRAGRESPECVRAVLLVMVCILLGWLRGIDRGDWGNLGGKWEGGGKLFEGATHETGRSKGAAPEDNKTCLTERERGRNNP